jgi:hypothetical protein
LNVNVNFEYSTTDRNIGKYFDYPFGGQNYNPTKPATVVVSSKTGSNANVSVIALMGDGENLFATADKNPGEILKIRIIDAGSGYSFPPEIDLTNSGDGTATANATVEPSKEIVIPAIPSTGRWVVLNIARTGAGNLGASIKGISVKLGSAGTPATASKYIRLDNIIACKTNDLNLQSLISKNSSEINSVTEPWHGIQSIDGTTILLDDDTSCVATAGRGYHGATETVTTYFRETFKTALASTGVTQISIINEGGTVGGGYTTFSGGWNTSTNLQDGETFQLSEKTLLVVPKQGCCHS